MSLSDVFAAIDPIAQKFGVPTKLWESVAQIETGFNPTAIGDNGTSFGVFQLHIGGQANNALQQGYTTTDLLNPGINAQFGIPAIASSWNSLKSSFDDSLGWWVKFAGQSGHPGVGSNTTDVATKLKAAYDSGNFGGGGVDGTLVSKMTPTSSTDSTPPPSSISQYASNVGGVLLFFLIAIVLFIVGIVLLR